MVRRVILLACAGILVFSMSACGKSQEAAKHQIEGSHVVSAESSVSAQEPEELSEAEPELPQDDEEITGAVEQIQDGTEEQQPEGNQHGTGVAVLGGKRHSPGRENAQYYFGRMP